MENEVGERFGERRILLQLLASCRDAEEQNERSAYSTATFSNRHNYLVAENVREKCMLQKKVQKGSK